MYSELLDCKLANPCTDAQMQYRKAFTSSGFLPQAVISPPFGFYRQMLPMQTVLGNLQLSQQLFNNFQTYLNTTNLTEIHDFKCQTIVLLLYSKSQLKLFELFIIFEKQVQSISSQSVVFNSIERKIIKKLLWQCVWNRCAPGSETISTHRQDSLTQDSKPLRRVHAKLNS